MKRYYYKICQKCSLKEKVKHRIFKRSIKTNRAKLQCCNCHKFTRRWYSYNQLEKMEKKIKPRKLKRLNQNPTARLSPEVLEALRMIRDKEELISMSATIKFLLNNQKRRS